MVHHQLKKTFMHVEFCISLLVLLTRGFCRPPACSFTVFNCFEYAWTEELPK